MWLGIRKNGVDALDTNCERRKKTTAKLNKKCIYFVRMNFTKCQK